MSLPAASIIERDRKPVVLVAALLSTFSILQSLDAEAPILARTAIALAYLSASFAVIRNWPHSRDVALVLVAVIVATALPQAVFAVFGVATPPVPARTYVSLAIAVVVLAFAVPSLVWLWRRSRRDV